MNNDVDSRVSRVIRALGDTSTPLVVLSRTSGLHSRILCFFVDLCGRLRKRYNVVVITASCLTGHVRQNIHLGGGNCRRVCDHVKHGFIRLRMVGDRSVTTIYGTGNIASPITVGRVVRNTRYSLHHMGHTI